MCGVCMCVYVCCEDCTVSEWVNVRNERDMFTCVYIVRVRACACVRVRVCVKSLRHTQQREREHACVFSSCA